MNQTYFVKNRKPEGRNGWCIMIVYDFQTSYIRSLKVRGATINEVATSRAMTKADIDHMNSINKYRMVTDSYYNWSDLIEDEMRVLGEGHPFIEEIKNISEDKRYYLIPKNNTGKQIEMF